MAVDHIPQDGVSLIGHMDANLMGPARLQAAPDMGIPPVPCDDLIMGHGMAAVFLRHSHLFPVRGVAANGRVNGAAVIFHTAADNGLIRPGQGVVRQLGRQFLMGEIVFRHNQQTRRVFINAVDDAGPQFAVNAG